MREDASRIRVGELLRQAYDRMPRRRFWVAVAGAITVALAIALPLSALVLFHEGPWTGFAWDFLVRLPFALLWIAFVLVAVREARTGRWKALSAFALVLLLFALVTGLAWLKLVRQAWGLVHSPADARRWGPSGGCRVPRDRRPAADPPDHGGPEGSRVVLA